MHRYLTRPGHESCDHPRPRRPSQHDGKVPPVRGHRESETGRHREQRRQQRHQQIGAGNHSQVGGFNYGTGTPRDTHHGINDQDGEDSRQHLNPPIHHPDPRHRPRSGDQRQKSEQRQLQRHRHTRDAHGSSQPHELHHRSQGHEQPRDPVPPPGEPGGLARHPAGTATGSSSRRSAARVRRTTRNLSGTSGSPSLAHFGTGRAICR